MVWLPAWLGEAYAKIYNEVGTKSVELSEAAVLLNSKGSRTKLIMSRLVEHGWAVRMDRGTYALKNPVEVMRFIGADPLYVLPSFIDYMRKRFGSGFLVVGSVVTLKYCSDSSYMRMEDLAVLITDRDRIKELESAATWAGRRVRSKFLRSPKIHFRADMDEEIFIRRRHVIYGGTKIPIPSLEDAVLLMINYWAKDPILPSTKDIKGLILAGAKRIDWHALVERAKEMGIAPALGMWLDTIHSDLTVPLSQELFEDLRNLDLSRFVENIRNSYRSAQIPTRAITLLLEYSREHGKKLDFPAELLKKTFLRPWKHSRYREPILSRWGSAVPEDITQTYRTAAKVYAGV